VKSDVSKRTDRQWQDITGLSRDQLSDIAARVASALGERRGFGGSNFKVGLFNRVVITVIALRRNHRQVELAAMFGVDQATISRYLGQMVKVVGDVLAEYVPTVEDLDPGHVYVIDGTLLPCWSWRSNPGLYSGKHHTTGMSVQVASYLDGTLAWVSDTYAGSTHDARAIRDSGFLHEMSGNVIADRGYIGLEILTPHRKPAGGELTAQQRGHNTAINRARYVIERTIAHLKNWNVLHTDYRRPINTFSQTITTVTALEFYRQHA
jgi:transposase